MRRNHELRRPVVMAALVLAAAGADARVQGRGGRPAGDRVEELQGRGHSQGAHPRVLEEHPRGRDQGRRATSPRRASQVEIIWKGPLREDDREQQVQVVEGVREPGGQRHRARAARRQGAGAAGRGSEAARDPDGHHRLRPRLGGDRELRRHRQLQGRRAGRRGDGPAAGRQGEGAPAALSGGLGQHRGPRARLRRPKLKEQSPGHRASSRATSTRARRGTPPSAPPRTC